MTADKMPHEIWAYFDDGNGALWHSPRPDQDQSAVKYTRADLSPPVPDDVAEAVHWCRFMFESVSNKSPQDIEKMEMVFRAASTPPVPVDTIAVPGEVLQGVREALVGTRRLVSQCAEDGFGNHDNIMAVYVNNGNITKTLASLDAVLSEGE